MFFGYMTDLPARLPPQAVRGAERRICLGRIDIEAKNYFSDSGRFADALNYCLYDGQPVIEPDKLSPLDTEEVIIPYGNEAREPEQRYRDLLDLWQVMTDGRAIYTVAFGGEIQADIHYAMPVKNGLYDFIYYARQVKQADRSYRNQDGKEDRIDLSWPEQMSGFRKEDRLIPVITVTIYLGASAWDGPRSIREMLNTDDKQLLSFVQDYRIHLIAPYLMADDDFRKFRTDFGQLMEYIKYSMDDEKLDQITHEGDRYRNLDVDLANLINEVTGRNLKFEVKEGKVDVCKAHEEMKRKAAEEAWEQANQRIREVEAERDEYKSELNEYKSELDKALRTIRMYEAR